MSQGEKSQGEMSQGEMSFREKCRTIAKKTKTSINQMVILVVVSLLLSTWWLVGRLVVEVAVERKPLVT